MTWRYQRLVTRHWQRNHVTSGPKYITGSNAERYQSPVTPNRNAGDREAGLLAPAASPVPGRRS